MITGVLCKGGCGVELDQAVIDEGHDTHQGCVPGFRPATLADVLACMRARNRAFYAEHNAYARQSKMAAGASARLWNHGARARGEAAAKLPDVEHRPQGSPQVLTSADDHVAQLRAARDALPKAGTRRREVYDAILTAGRRGLTHSELSERLNRSYSVNGPRVRELVQDGHVMRAPQMRKGDSGSLQEVWVAIVNVPEQFRVRVTEWQTP